MTTKTTTVCDNCGQEAQDPKGEGWQKINLHPWGTTPRGEEAVSDGVVDDRWLIRDLCPSCAAKVRQWLTGELVAVFRLPRGKGSKETPVE